MGTRHRSASTLAFGLTMAVVTVMALGAPVASAGTGVPDADLLRSIAGDWRSSVGAPGVVVGARVGDGVPVIVAVGDVSDGSAPLSADATFEIASITKTFTGRLILDLADQGLLSLDDPLARWLPDFPGADRITIRQLLTHTSGIPPQWTENGSTPWSDEMLALVISDLEHQFTPEEVLALVGDRPLRFEPGKGIQYSNVNAILLGQVVAAVTDTDYATALHERLLTPLGLTDTAYRGIDEGQHATGGVGRLPDGTAYDTGTMPDRALLSFMGAAGAMVATPGDLLDWGVDDLRAGALGATDLAHSRFQVSPEGTALGVIPWSSRTGFCIFGDCSGPAMYDAVTGIGLSPGTSSMVAYLPDSDLTLIALSNSSATEVDGLMARLVSALVPGP